MMSGLNLSRYWLTSGLGKPTFVSGTPGTSNDGTGTTWLGPRLSGVLPLTSGAKMITSRPDCCKCLVTSTAVLETPSILGRKASAKIATRLRSEERRVGRDMRSGAEEGA